MPRYAPELCASVIDDYLHTGKSVGLIAREHAIGERDVTRIRQAAGVPTRRTRARSLPPAMAGLVEARALLRATAANAEGAEPGAALVAPQTPDGAAAAPAAPAAPAAAIDRIERLIEQELAAEEAGRAQLGLLPRAPGDAERCARTLAILTKTLHALGRLHGGAIDQGLRHDDDDMPADIDDFRNELARRIHAFVDSRTGGGVHGRASGNDGPTDA